MGSLSSLKSLCVKSSLVVQFVDLTVDRLNIAGELSQLSDENIDHLRITIEISGSLISCRFSIGHSGGKSRNFSVEGTFSGGKAGELSSST